VLSLNSITAASTSLAQLDDLSLRRRCETPQPATPTISPASGSHDACATVASGQESMTSCQGRVPSLAGSTQPAVRILQECSSQIRCNACAEDRRFAPRTLAVFPESPRFSDLWSTTGGNPVESAECSCQIPPVRRPLCFQNACSAFGIRRRSSGENLVNLFAHLPTPRRFQIAHRGLHV